MEKLLTEIKEILKNYPDYNEVIFDEKKNIIIKKKIEIQDKSTDTITAIVKKLIREDLK